MTERAVVTIVGQPVDAWLAAVMLARFAPTRGARLQVLETAPPPTEREEVIARPEMVRTHVSIGLNLKSLGARPVQCWAGPDAQQIPFNAPGSPLHGVSFAAIWMRAHNEFGETRPLQSFASDQVSGAFALEVGRYVHALKAIATQVGIETCEQAEGHVILSDPEFEGGNSSTRIGAAAIDLQSSATLRLQSVHQSVLALIECWPWHDRDRDLAVKEYERRLSGIGDSLGDMQAVLWQPNASAKHSISLQHRIAVWRQIGRITPVDDDLFQAQEWMTVLLHAGVMPSRCGRLARTLTRAEIEAHIEACAPKEVANV